MDEVRIRKYVKALNSYVTKADDNRVTFPCMFAPWKHQNGVDNNPSSSITIKPKGESRYHCFSCNTTGYLDEVVLELRSLLKDDPDKKYYSIADANKLVMAETDEAELDIPDYEDEDYDLKHANKLIPWDEHFIDSFFKVQASSKAKEYLLKRGVPPKIWSKLDLRYDTSEKRICFPVRSFDGELVGMRGRDITNTHFLRYRAYKYHNHYNKQVWLGEEWVDLESTVVMTESVFDLTSIIGVYENVVASFSSGISKNQATRMTGALDVVTLYDYGKGGDIARETIDKYFKDSIVQHVIPSKEQDDAGACTTTEIYELLKSYVDVKKPV